MKRYLLFSVACVLLVGPWATGCGGEPTLVAPQEEIATQDQSTERRELRETPGEESAPVSGSKEATMTPEPSPEPTQIKPPAEAEVAVKAAREDLAERLGMAPDEIQLVSVEAVEWSDASLGCPQPGMMYAQVITPGYRVVFEMDGAEYEYHTDTGDNVILCQSEAGDEGTTTFRSPVEAPQVVPPAEAQQAVKLAQEDLVGRLGLALDAIRVVSVEAVEWSDTSLGCPQPGMMYAQVITPGFLVMLEAGGEEYEYHTDTGRFAVLCAEQ